MNVIENLIDPERYYIKCPYDMIPKCIVVHNTANSAPAINEITYMHRNDLKKSFHFAIDDEVIMQGLPLNRNSWHAGDGMYGYGNRYGVSIEICYSKYGGEKFDKAEDLTAQFIANLLKYNNWDITRVKKHQDFDGKYCPHRTLDGGWYRFLSMIERYLYKGDVNGDGKTDLKDVALLKQYLAKWNVQIDEDQADVNNDGKINIKDISEILKIL